MREFILKWIIKESDSSQVVFVNNLISLHGQVDNLSMDQYKKSNTNNNYNGIHHHDNECNQVHNHRYHPYWHNK